MRADYFSIRPIRELRTTAKSHRRTTGRRKPAEEGGGRETDERAAGRKERGKEEQRRAGATRTTTASERKKPRSARAEEVEEQPKQTTTDETQIDHEALRQSGRTENGGSARDCEHEVESRDGFEGARELSRSPKLRNASGPAQRNAERGRAGGRGRAG
ncbi:hypothetical protein RI578_40565 (plasmid) [Streptomyces sp. BB1-1-1]|uniref:hypothetical protein n=1 Tax=Streptomyces sp. BB1-1-1 TaxID=3074430 RepID=UPI0028774CEF|nr:hypothetical protein [Streptomyces sp. BB1-1-1]WND40588.1 hypothetical protein RI578_40565 [Streptomyces sp. BB1-1-1]